MRSLRHAAGRGFGVASLILLLAVGPAAPLLAEETDETAGASSGPGWGAKTLDVAILRPLYFGQTVVGAVMFGIALPVTLLSGKDDRQIAYETFVETPADDTFTRPLGSF